MTSIPPKDIKLPSIEVLQQAARLAIVEDKPILYDYWIPSIEKQAYIAQDTNDTKRKLLVKNAQEFTSNIENIYYPKGTDAYIVKTENSIYIVSNDILKKKITAKI
jgi:hypothetical protein